MHQNSGAGEAGYATMLSGGDAAVNRNQCETTDLSDTIIEFRHVEYSVPTSSRPILSDVSLSIHSGERIALIGRSGSGKTTLLKLINRLRQRTSGGIFVEGREVLDWDPIQLRRSIGYVIQEVGLLPHLTVRENVCLVPQLQNWPAERIASRCDDVLQSVGLSPAEYSKRYPRQLSGGQRQRVGVARALAAAPKILLMDEPFGALDPVTRAELQNEFLALTKEISQTVILVTHDVREALLLGTRIILLDAGRVIAESSPAAFLVSENPIARQFLDAAQLAAGASA